MSDFKQRACAQIEPNQSMAKVGIEAPLACTENQRFFPLAGFVQESKVQTQRGETFVDGGKTQAEVLYFFHTIGDHGTKIGV